MRVVHWAAPLLVAGLAWTLAPLHFAAPPAPLPAAAAPVWQAEPPAPVPAPPVVVDAPAAPGPPAIGRLRIPSAGVDAAIEAVLVDGGGRMAVPSGPERVGWYAAGPRPGSAGDAVLDGHLDTASGSAVFGRLGSLRAGDAVLVDWGAGESIRFTVASVRVFAYDAHPDGLFANAGPARISLITCTGAWDPRLGTYRQRLVVDAVLSVT